MDYPDVTKGDDPSPEFPGMMQIPQRRTSHQEKSDTPGEEAAPADGAPAWAVELMDAVRRLGERLDAMGDQAAPPKSASPATPLTAAKPEAAKATEPPSPPPQIAQAAPDKPGVAPGPSGVPQAKPIGMVTTEDRERPRYPQTLVPPPVDKPVFGDDAARMREERRGVEALPQPAPPPQAAPDVKPAPQSQRQERIEHEIEKVKATPVDVGGDPQRAQMLREKRVETLEGLRDKPTGPPQKLTPQQADAARREKLAAPLAKEIERLEAMPVPEAGDEEGQRTAELRGKQVAALKGRREKIVGKEEKPTDEAQANKRGETEKPTPDVAAKTKPTEQAVKDEPTKEARGKKPSGQTTEKQSADRTNTPDEKPLEALKAIHAVLVELREEQKKTNTHMVTLISKSSDGGSPTWGSAG